MTDTHISEEPDAVEMLYIESSTLSLVEFRRRITGLVQTHDKAVEPAIAELREKTTVLEVKELDPPVKS